ncbi:phage holin family protein [Neisseria animalis]|uniref:Uncharacterized protein n=1 Tax=Neisseria animalis TaxID=492 RepID=A0A5P3MVG8_NEIAN|nr:phage holin family protein [Neisseria animalis]QEY24761.1 hypothetical protein D0T90_10040 [Neisseria animalis]ROW31839.1 hypothetical protein CGZ60_08130 [Neisseria animalis]VEE07769.1 Uncharacterised protein [Neisseria animalis]
MNIREKIDHAQTLLSQGINLLLLRMQILNLDLADQAANIFRILIALAVSSVLLLAALISLFFGLNRLLSETAAIWTFFSIAAAALLIIFLLLYRASSLWRKQNNRIAATLRDIQTDIACLRGKTADNTEGKSNVRTTQQ